jgi:hypothetical protein
MLIYYALGRLGVQQAREASHSALPDAPVVEDRNARPAVLRIRTAGALHRLADRIGPIEAPACHGSPQQA